VAARAHSGAKVARNNTVINMRFIKKFLSGRNARGIESPFFNTMTQYYTNLLMNTKQENTHNMVWVPHKLFFVNRSVDDDAFIVDVIPAVFFPVEILSAFRERVDADGDSCPGRVS
jgi:hypothetical protein